MMKAIFISPYNALWAEEINFIAKGTRESITSFGVLLRQEIKSGSEIGIELKAALSSGEVISRELIGSVFDQNFLKQDSSMILTNLPLSKSLATVIANIIKKEIANADIKLLVVKSDMYLVLARIDSQFNADILVESKIATIVGSYYGENGWLSGAKTLSELSGIEVIKYSNPNNIVAEVYT